MVGQRLKRVKTSHAVVEYVHRQILDGHLRPGDRIDVDAISSTLAVSPAPIREALVLLERDGLIASQMHRSAHVEPFDAHTLRADFHVLGLLSGVAVARVAKHRDPDVIAELRQLTDQLASTRAADDDRRGDLSRAILRLEHRAGATPRIRAELGGFSTFLVQAIDLTGNAGRRDSVDAHREVFAAIASGASRRASRARLEHARSVGEHVIAELVRRGVLAHLGLDDEHAAG